MSSPTPDPASDPNRPLRWVVYTVLIALALGQAAGKILAVNAVNVQKLEQRRVAAAIDKARAELTAQGVKGEEFERQLAERSDDLRHAMRLQRPFLSANDRSRWMAIRAIAEEGDHEIERYLGEPTWDTIDMVQHRGRDGELHQYSSKPPLLMVLIAAPYWLIIQTTGMTLGTHPYVVGRILMLLVSGGSLLVLLASVAHLAERWGATDAGRIFAVAVAALGTQLSAFTPVLNNHLIAAASAAVALVAWSRIRFSPDSARAIDFVVAGLAAAFTVVNELPALAFFVLLGGELLLRHTRGALALFLPAAALVAAAFFGTTYWAHASWKPPYAHRSETDLADNWYDYSYTVNGRERDSYWRRPSSIDRGEPSKATYALHTLVGHHGVFSLTPVWLLSAAGGLAWLLRGDRARRELALGVLGLSAVCLTFYIGFRPQGDRNYGGMTNGLRWMFWFVPLWCVLLMPAADRLLRSRGGAALCGVLLAFSALSASYPTWNPWTQPWIYNWLDHLGFTLI
ncbi:hypothetical protein Mal64_04920 [Pseudobythopirellula maris]|uniref:Glycosyltransferase RgtA/B/C/D-like domain-containing protein n=1 Tax=Pseudobythopirellula maris TaxID=2527991 RepID=A0A5C5ZRH0_9BACT|nr:hypothetical protein [Pseudobythopirellula maris]TWT90109.1 hypothetical protein Mal64_04920 [Pseudobythopirellula maris]